MKLLHESDNKACPWTAFEVQFAKEYHFEDHQDFADSQVGQKSKEKKAWKLKKDAASRKRAGACDAEVDKKLEEDLQALTFPTSRGPLMESSSGCVKRCGKSSWKVIALHTHNNASFGGVAEEALKMYQYAFENQIDIYLW